MFAARVAGLHITGVEIDEDLAQIAKANGARDFLQHALACPADHPVDQCPHMIEVLDKRLAGTTIEQIAAEQGQPQPITPTARRKFSRRG